MRYEILLIAVALVCYLVIHHRRARVAVKAERGAMFDECASLFDEYRIKQDGIYYPLLRGLYKGYDMTLEPI
ncbi:MAG: hypothetical protein JRJ60_20190, partial [Deltaproteobacteria bacterium]|nr:hypothetical protein [Deltaproteobacteria bacterium]